MRYRLPSGSVQPALRLVLFLGAVPVGAGAGAASDNWIDHAAADPFVCRSEFRLADGQQLIRDLKQLESDVNTLLELPTGSQAIQLNLFRNRRNYTAYLSQRVPEAVGRRAIYVQGPDMGRVYVYNHLAHETDIRHECTHALLHQSLPYVPLWLDEGLAEYFEVDTGKRVAANPHLRSLKTRILLGWRPDLTSLESKRHFSELTDSDYRECWAWVHFLLHRSDESRAVLVQYLGDIAVGAPPGYLSERLQHSIPDAEAQLIDHFKSFGQFKFFAN